MAKEEDEGTIAKTLWSETILEILYETLKKNKDDEVVLEVLKEVRQKGFKPDYIIDRTAKKVDQKAAFRVKQLLQSKKA